MNKVNTFIIGAQKAGTTSLYNWMGQHPDINAPGEVKDYHFFTNENLYKKGVTHLHNLYRNDNSRIQLHAAVNYLYFHETAAKRLYEYNPESKLIICLRNPVARAISAYKYFIRTNREGCSLEKAINRELNGEIKKNKLSDHTYLSHGKYMEQINGFMKYFDKSQLHFLLFEELVNEDRQKGLITDLFSFLSINCNFKVDYTHRNKSGQLKSSFLNWILREDYPFKSVKNLIPFSIRKKIGNKLEEINISNQEINVNVTDQKKEFMYDYFQDSVRELDEFLDQDLSKVWGF